MVRFPYAAARLPSTRYQQVNLQLNPRLLPLGHSWLYKIAKIFNHHRKVPDTVDVEAVADLDRKQCLGDADIFVRIQLTGWFIH
jgi:hypothetical protein